jgi:hypothetical protein
VSVPGGNPVTEEPGVNPISPVTTLGPVFVIVLEANTAKPAAPLRTADPTLLPGSVSLLCHWRASDGSAEAAPEANVELGPVMLFSERGLELQPNTTSATVSRPRAFRIPLWLTFGVFI